MAQSARLSGNAQIAVRGRCTIGTMRRVVRTEQPGPSQKRSPAATPAAGPAARALALQRTAGNRATGRMLARWVKHPDEEKKGVMVPDGVASEFLRLNPPSNK
jgi:hypothetical protein